MSIDDLIAILQEYSFSGFGKAEIFIASDYTIHSIVQVIGEGPPERLQIIIEAS